MIRASQVLFWFGLSIATSIALYHTSDRTRELDHELRMTNNAIEAEQQKIHVLKAEWVFLANPARIESEAKKYLTALRPTTPRQVIDLADFAATLPMHKEKVAAVAPPPVATIKTARAAPTPAPVKPIKMAAAAPVEPAQPARKEKPASAAVKPAVVKTAFVAPPAAKLRKTAPAVPRHINDHMIMQRASITIPPVSANTQPTDKIGALIAELGSHP